MTIPTATPSPRVALPWTRAAVACFAAGAFLAATVLACGTQAAVAPGGGANSSGAQSAAVSARAPSLPPPTSALGGVVDGRLRVELLDNGAFVEDNAAALDRDGVRRIPWWRSKLGLEQVVELDDELRPRKTPAPTGSRARRAARTQGDEFVEQPAPAFAPYARGVRVTGQVLGAGRVIVRDGQGEAVFALEDAPSWTPFEITGDALAAKLGREPMPRFVVRFEPADAAATAHWSELSATSELPCPSEAELRAELRGVLEWIFHECLTRGIDSVGPKKTGWFCHDFDAVTGERITTVRAVSFYSFFDLLRMALEGEDVPEWRAGFDVFLTSLLELGLHPVTGLPRAWDCEADVARDDLPLEIGLTLGFLIDVAERGPERWKERCRAAAIKIGETVLEKGILPDGNVAASYLPADARVNLNIGRLRRLDVLVHLARLSKLTGDARFEAASREALWTFEYSHLWSGTWQQIDPAFDDEYGHYGARAAASWRAAPQEKVFRELALEGWKHFQPLWTDSVRLGGTCAADQVRCWVLLMDVAELAPEEKEAIRSATWSALRGHFKGEQGGRGAWEDLTVIDYDPQLTFAQKVGDFPGAPQNLLHGLSAVYEPGYLRTDEVRAMFTAVMRSSIETYKRPHGFLMERFERKGPNTALGSMRMLLGLAKMFSKLK
ncbi:MAG: hypothetical protein IPJ77_07200 [Planctomycetes bacterium]|nr:hypothetical protein [Planctomycetota bacterium]